MPAEPPRPPDDERPGPPEGLAAAVPDDGPPTPIPLKGRKAEAPERERPAEGEPFENVQGDTYTFHWPSLGVRAVLDGFIEEKDGLKCRLLVLAEPPNSPGLLHQSRINLEAQRTRSEVVNKLARRLPRIEWEALAEHMIFLALDRYREGEPVIKLTEVDYQTRSPVLMSPFLSGDGGTILFGDGSSGKSTFALALAADLSYGGGRLGKTDGRLGCVLYLDWEDSERAHAERLYALTDGLRLPDVPEIYYRHMVASLPESIGSIRRIVADLNADLVVIDSLVAACGGPIEDSRYVAHLFECCRSFGKPWLGITHITQEAARIQQASPGGYVAPFGSRFVHNLARMTWMLERDQAPGSTEGSLMLTNWKNNHGPLHQRQIFKVTYEAQDGRLFSVGLRPGRIEDSPRFVKAGSLRTQILHHLRTGNWTAEDLAETTGKPKKEVQTRLNEMRAKEEVLKQPDGVWRIHAKQHEGYAPPPGPPDEIESESEE